MQTPEANPDLVVWLELRGRKEPGHVRIDARCKALTTIGTCAIHSTRPMCCRVFQVGSSDCLAAIRAQRRGNAAQLIKLARQHSEVA